MLSQFTPTNFSLKNNRRLLVEIRYKCIWFVYSPKYKIFREQEDSDCIFLWSLIRRWKLYSEEKIVQFTSCSWTHYVLHIPRAVVSTLKSSNNSFVIICKLFIMKFLPVFLPVNTFISSKTLGSVFTIEWTILSAIDIEYIYTSFDCFHQLFK